MFHSHQDKIRPPKKPEIPSTLEDYRCDMCDKGGWPSENDVEIHKKNAHFITVNNYKALHKDRFCTVCMKLLESHHDLIRHIKSEHLLSSPNAHRIERKIFICEECTHIFFNKGLLETHILYAHTTKKNNRKNILFTCPKCLQILPLNSIWFHFQKHDIPSVSLCDICLTNFPSRSALHEHIWTHNSYYTCEPCGYNSTKEHLFLSHMEKHVHIDIPRKKVSYGIVNRVFKRHRSKLVRYNVHNAFKGLNLPKFIEICTLCREICVNKAEVKMHILRDHRMNEKFEKKMHFCVCGEEFSHRVVLKQHVMKMKGSHQPADEVSSSEGTANSLIHYSETSMLEANAENVSYAQCEGEVVTDEITENPHIEVEICSKVIIGNSINNVDHMDYTVPEDPDRVLHGNMCSKDIEPGQFK